MPTVQAALAKVAILLASVQIALAASGSATYTIYPPDRLTEAQIWAAAPILRTIDACESTGDPNGTPRQFNSDGSVLWGIDPKTNKPIERDCGISQINTKVHAPEIAKLGLDVCHSEEDNVYFEWILYQQFGMSPWSASESCWNPKSTQ